MIVPVLNLEIVTDNPIFVRELRRRMRGRGLMFTMILYLVAMCGIAYLIISSKTSEILNQQFSDQATNYPRTTTTISEIGESLFFLIAAIQSVLVLIVAPSITAAMVKNEKERETFDFLRVTTLSSPTYVLGALASTVLYVALALFCALPIFTIGYLYGGISNIVPTTLLLLAFSVLLSSVGLLISCITERYGGNQASIGIALALILFIFFGTRSIFAPSSGSLMMATMTIVGFSLPTWVALCLGCLFVSAFILLIAMRKLYHPEERGLSYAQSGTAYLLFTLTICYLGLFPGAIGSSGLPQRWLAEILMGLFIGALLLQNNAMFTRVEIGNERWRLKRARPAMRKMPDDQLFAAVIPLAGFGILLLIQYVKWGTLQPTGLAILPLVAYLGAHLVTSYFLLKRIGSEFAALRVLVIIDVALLILPLIVAGGISNILPGLSEMVRAISPIEAAHLLLTQPGHPSANFCIMLYCGLAALIWLVGRHVAALHENTHVNYEISL